MNRLGNILNRLISTRAYAAGRLPAVELEIEAIREKLKALEAERIALPLTIAHCDQRIKELSLIDVDDIRAIRLNERHSISPYGGVIRDVIHFFQSRAGQGIGTDELKAYLWRVHFDASTPSRVVTKRAKDLCRDLMKRGVLERLESRRCERTKQMRAVWRWVGNAAMNSAPQLAGGLSGQAGNTEVIDSPAVPFAAVVCPVD